MAATATKRLEALRQAEVKARQRSREMDLAANAAMADADRARSTLVEAHAAGDARAIKAAEKARGEAVDRADNAGIEAEGAQMRAERAAKTTQVFEVENARALIAELAPAGGEVAARLERSARELIAANAEWLAIAQRVGELLVVMPGATPANDAPSTHALESVVRDVRRALDLGAVPSPLPHYRGLQDHAERERGEVERREAGGRGHDPS